MEGMNSFELELRIFSRMFLKMILEIMDECKDIEEAQEKIKALLER